MENQKTIDQTDLTHKLSAVGWALFFIWIGISFLVNLGLGLGLLGVGIITLGMQLIRKSYNLKLEGFWVVIGLLFMLGGLGNILRVNISIVPIVLILGGIALLYSIIKSKG
jgi:hypothetical protein